MVNNLIQTLQIAPEYKDQTIKEIFNLMGLPEPHVNKPNPLQPQPQMGPDGKPMMPGQSTQQGIQQPQPMGIGQQALATKSNVANQQGLM